MEFLRLGSSIPGAYWGCCAVCIIQNFKFDPDQKASIQIVSGDSGGAIGPYAGPTYRDIFKQRIRIGTFSTDDMPNHAFLAVLEESQIHGTYGKAWLKILKEEGFEFIRTVDNSVYTGKSLTGRRTSPHPNHIFGLFRNITGSRIKDPFTPPPAWTDLPAVVPESWELSSQAKRVKFAQAQTEVHKAHWIKSGPTKLMSREEITQAGAPVILAGSRKDGAAPHQEVLQAVKATAFPKVAFKAA